MPAVLRPRPLLLLASLSVSLAALAPAGQASAKSVRQLVEAAAAARAAGDLEGCVNLLQQAYDKEPQPELLNNMGRVLEDLGRYADAHDAYRKVADDPRAPSDLRSLDAARMAALRPKLGRAWLTADLKPPAAWIRTSGGRLSAGSDGEFGVPAGNQLIEVISPDGTLVYLVALDLKAGRRTELQVNLTKPPADYATLDVRALPSGRSLVVDGHVVADARGLRPHHVWLPAGSHRLTVGSSDARVTLAPGQSAMLADLVDLSGGSVEKPRTSDGPGAAPWIVVASGGALVLAGGITLYHAETLRQEIDDLPRDERGVIIGMTQVEVDDQLDQADTETLVGAILMGVGGVAAISGIVWGVAGSAGSDEPSVRITPAPGGLVVGGSF